MNNSIVIIGNLGHEARPDGQTIRTKTVLETIEKHYGDEYSVIFISTNRIQIAKIFLYCKAIIGASKIVIMPGQRAIKTIVSLMSLLGVSERVVHVAIGGWLPKCVEEDTALLKQEKKFKAILVQMDSIRQALHKQGLVNAVWFPNYRNSSRGNIPIKNVEKAPQKFVFYSRVIREKGVFTAVEAIKRLTNEGEDILLDIYGPIDDMVRQELEQEIENYANIKYCRVLYGDEILEVLSQYDCMLFPTCYTGEGFPGAVLESMMAGVPVIATDWKYNGEIIKDGENGIICGDQAADNVYKSIKKIRENLILYQRICKGAFFEAEKYTEKKVVSVLIDSLDKIGQSK